MAGKFDSKNMRDANFPMDADGRTYHVQCKAGEIANHLILVGDSGRAKALAATFDFLEFSRESSRGFLVFTGQHKGKRISIIAIGMGYPMMDFAIREVLAVTEGPMDFIRLGTCGSFTEPLGTVIVAESSILVQQNPDALITGSKQGYRFSAPVMADPDLHRDLLNAMRREVDTVATGGDATCDLFYSSQGRQDPNFRDCNKDLLAELLRRYPQTKSLQMETFQLLFMPHICKRAIRTASAAIVLANRDDQGFLPDNDKHALELKAARAIFATLQGS